MEPPSFHIGILKKKIITSLTQHDERKPNCKKQAWKWIQSYSKSSQPISTLKLTNNFWNIKSILFWQGFHAVTKLLNAMKIRKNQFIWCLKSRDKAKVSYSQKCGSLEIYSDVIGRAGCFISNGTLKSGLLSADKGFNPKQSLLNKIFRSYETKSSINI